MLYLTGWCVEWWSGMVTSPPVGQGCSLMCSCPGGSVVVRMRSRASRVPSGLGGERWAECRCGSGTVALDATPEFSAGAGADSEAAVGSGGTAGWLSCPCADPVTKIPQQSITRKHRQTYGAIVVIRKGQTEFSAVSDQLPAADRLTLKIRPGNLRAEEIHLPG